jgi:hypothetical protein
MLSGARHTWLAGTPPTRIPLLSYPKRFIRVSLGNHELVRDGGLLGPQGTDLLEDLWAEPRQNLDAVLGEIVDRTLPLPMADHAEVAA